MLRRSVLNWMYLEERTVGYLSCASDIGASRLVDLLSGDGSATNSELVALAQATSLPVEDMGSTTAVLADGAVTDPLRCYTVAEASSILGVSQDTVRKEVKEGALAHVVLGERALRIPRGTPGEPHRLSDRSERSNRSSLKISAALVRCAYGHPTHSSLGVPLGSRKAEIGRPGRSACVLSMRTSGVASAPATRCGSSSISLTVSGARRQGRTEVPGQFTNIHKPLRFSEEWTQPIARCV